MTDIPTRDTSEGNGLPLGNTGEAHGEVGSPYIVLARKYRPESFKQLIGQDAMVTTLRNAFAADRIAQGYMLTGVRGVGKTTTARIIARALNYSKPGLPDRPTVEIDGYGEHCLQIIQSRHPDVLEMDAASNTGIDNVREIIENARYKPLVARYKVFIIDEVHMLSKSAFNALLKTLEEPPAHVKFIFATTEVRKVPVTVLSRCQRFDLRRVDVPLLVSHFKSILETERATSDDDALALIGRAAGGSVRDGLSILDQAIAMGAGNVTTTAVRAMLGLADRGRVFDLLEALLAGKAGEALKQLEQLHRDGGDPAQILADLAEAIHTATRAKIVGADAAGDELSAEEKQRAGALAQRLSVPVLTRAWQMLQKGLEETSRATSPMQAAEMVLIRIAHAADLPSPDDLIRILGPGSRTSGTAVSGQQTGNGAPQGSPVMMAAGGSHGRVAPVAVAQSLPQPQTFPDVLALVGAQRDARLRVHLEENVSLVRFEPGRIELFLLPDAPAGLAGELGEKLTKWTGQRWVIAIGRQMGEPPVGVVNREREAAEAAELKTHPAVRTLLEVFPEAELKHIRPLTDRNDTTTD
ncbi:DNA polymerase III subunit gamma/tau [Leptospira interrogans]